MSFKIQKYRLDKPAQAYKFCIDVLNLSMKQSQILIAKRRLISNGQIILKPNTIIDGNIEVYIFYPQSKELKPVFEHSDFVVYDKPSFVYSIPKNRDTDYSISHEAKATYGKYANPIHRLDYETSGLIIVSKNKESEKELKKIFENREIVKTYIAIIKGKLDKELTLEIPLEINHDYTYSKHKVKVSPSGKKSSTYVKPLEYNEELNQTKVKLIPLTGRMHQLRVHLFHIFHPIVGDPLYGTNFDFANDYLDNRLDDSTRIKTIGSTRLMLHASSLSFKYKNEKFKIKSLIKFVF